MKMPAPTRIMLEVSDLVKSYGWFVLGGLAVVLSCGAFTPHGGGPVVWDGARLKVPLLAWRCSSGDGAVRAPPWPRCSKTRFRCAVDRDRAATLNNRMIANSLVGVATG